MAETEETGVGPGSERDATYLFPRHGSEVDRLDVQHYALHAKLGVHHLAPVERPALVLDVGAGTGQWGHDLCAEFPEALVVGLDLVPGKPGPPNYRFVRADVLAGLPFTDGRFDFVHQRLMGASAVPSASWPGELRELVRVTRSGGWVELVESMPAIEPAGPATGRLVDMTRRLAASLGLDVADDLIHSLGEDLAGAGVADVRVRSVDLPVGEWEGKVGSLMASNCRAAFTRLRPSFEAKLGVPAVECDALISAARTEWEEHRSACPVTLAYGRRP